MITMRRATLFSFALLLSGQTAIAAAPAITREAFNGIWSGEQGVLWDTSVKSGERPRAPFTPEYAARYQESDRKSVV